MIASPQEAALIRALPQAKGKLIVTPGVRPAGAATGDQKRIATPHQAITDGADHIVVGRPIWQAKDPAAAARAVSSELPARLIRFFAEKSSSQGLGYPTKRISLYISK